MLEIVPKSKKCANLMIALIPEFAVQIGGFVQLNDDVRFDVRIETWLLVRSIAPCVLLLPIPIPVPALFVIVMSQFSNRTE